MGKVNTNIEGYNLKETGKWVDTKLHEIDDKATKSSVNSLENNIKSVKNDVSELKRAYKAGGTISTISDLPALDSEHLGYVYNVETSFTTTSDFLEGAGKECDAGTEVGIVDIGTNDTPLYKYNIVGSFVDLSNYYTKDNIDDKLYDVKTDIRALDIDIGDIKSDLGTVQDDLGSVDKKIKDEINTFATAITADGTVNTYKEALDWIAQNGNDYTALLGQVTENTNGISALHSQVLGAPQEYTISASWHFDSIKEQTTQQTIDIYNDTTAVTIVLNISGVITETIDIVDPPDGWMVDRNLRLADTETSRNIYMYVSVPKRRVWFATSSALKDDAFLIGMEGRDLNDYWIEWQVPTNKIITQNTSASLADLSTTDTSNIISAINEIANKLVGTAHREATARENADKALSDTIGDIRGQLYRKPPYYDYGVYDPDNHTTTREPHAFTGTSSETKPYLGNLIYFRVSKECTNVVLHTLWSVEGVGWRFGMEIPSTPAHISIDYNFLPNHDYIAQLTNVPTDDAIITAEVVFDDGENIQAKALEGRIAKLENSLPNAISDQLQQQIAEQVTQALIEQMGNNTVYYEDTDIEIDDIE